MLTYHRSTVSLQRPHLSAWSCSPAHGVDLPIGEVLRGNDVHAMATLTQELLGAICITGPGEGWQTHGGPPEAEVQASSPCREACTDVSPEQSISRPRHHTPCINSTIPSRGRYTPASCASDKPLQPADSKVSADGLLHPSRERRERSLQKVASRFRYGSEVAQSQAGTREDAALAVSSDLSGAVRLTALYFSFQVTSLCVLTLLPA